jgi:hypothetical protein
MKKKGVFSLDEVRKFVVTINNGSKLVAQYVTIEEYVKNLERANILEEIDDEMYQFKVG